MSSDRAEAAGADTHPGPRPAAAATAWRRLVAVERSLWRARWIIAAGLLVQFAIYQPGVPRELPFPRWPVAALLVSALVVTNVASQAAARRLPPPRLRAIGITETVIDGALLLTVTALFGFDTTARLWPILALVIVEAGLREKLRGALVAWAVTMGTFVVIDVAWMAELGQTVAVDIGGTTLAALVLLVIAVSIGTLVRELDLAREQAQAHADRLRHLSSLTTRLSATRGSAETFREIARSALALTGFHAARLYVDDGSGWTDAASHPPAHPLLGELEPALAAGLDRREGVQPVELATTTGSPTVLAVPLPLRELDAVLLLAGPEVSDRVSEATVETLMLLAAQAAVTVETARLVEAGAATIAELQSLDAAKNDFLSLLGHELRTPMTSVAGYADMLNTYWSEVDEEQRRAYLEAVSRGTRRMSHLVQDVFDALRAQRDTLSITPVSVPLRQMLDEIGSELVEQSPRHDLEVEVLEEANEVWADPRRLEQVLTNLVSNAVKYSPKGGRVQLRATSDGETVSIAVIDEGLGIPPAEQHRLFTKFSRLHGETQITGTGLGLYLSDALVRAMDGRIDVSSSADGTTFTVLLPARAPAEPTPVDTSQVR